MQNLQQTLERFRSRVNEDLRVKSLIRNWRRMIVVKADDTGEVFTLRVDAGAITRVEPGDHGEDELILLSGDEQLIRGVFAGERNPAKEYLDGALTVLGDEADKMKLDAISVVLWGEIP